MEKRVRRISGRAWPYLKRNTPATAMGTTIPKTAMVMARPLSLKRVARKRPPPPNARKVGIPANAMDPALAGMGTPVTRERVQARRIVERKMEVPSPTTTVKREMT